MSKLEVRIERLEPMRAASVRVVSDTPERDAWDKMREWAEPLGLLKDIEKNPVFGFNNPSPAPDRREYGYEFWIRIDPDVVPEGDIQIIDFPGGLYAVTKCSLLGDPNILETWKSLWEWVLESKYEHRRRHELEKPQNPLSPEEDLILDLYFPIEE
jgi:AraC family transcriptional regulator